MRNRSFTVFSTLAVASVLSLPLNAEAGRIEEADAAFNTLSDSNYYQNGNDGQFFQAPETTSVTVPVNGNLAPLTLDFGSGPIAGANLRFSFEQTGRVSFLDSSGVPNGNYIEPMHLSGGYTTAYSNGSFTNGLLDPFYLTAITFPSFSSVFNPANGLQAFRFQWNGICPNSQYNGSVCTSNGLLNFQAVIIETDPEDFQLQFNYGNSLTSLPRDAISGGFKFGSSTATFTAGSDTNFATFGPNYCFHNGALVACSAAVVAVPEPSTMWLAMIGMVALASAMVRRSLLQPARRTIR